VGVARNGYPCDQVSRWRKFTFSKKEGENGVSVPQRFEATIDYMDCIQTLHCY
jgi:hypothetical protein